MSDIQRSLSDANGNASILNHQIVSQWANNPDFRGTPDILWSCVLTLTACVYTALHLNIPPNHRPQWRRIWTKIKWVLIALIGPEIVLLAAIRQLIQAGKLCWVLDDRNIDGLGPSKTSKAGSQTQLLERHESFLSKRYELTFGYFVAMGGFVVDVSDIHDTLTFVSINTTGVEFLAKRGHYLKMSKDKIADRSKANAVAKSIVCFQVVWMLVQCIARKAAGLPLALLELHTMVHIVCALCHYLCWWKKPLDIQEPEIVDDSEFKDIIAFMLIGSVPLNRKTAEKPGLVSSEPEAWELRKGPSQTEGPEASNTATPGPSSVGQSTEYKETLPPKYPKIETFLERLFDTKKQDTNGDGWLQKEETLECGIGPSAFAIKPSLKDMRRWTLAAQAMDNLEPNSNYAIPKERYDDRKCIKECKGLRTHASNIPMLGNRLPTRKFRTLRRLFSDKTTREQSSLILSLIYGGIHLAAWNYHFATRTERILWRMSGISIMAFPLFQTFNIIPGTDYASLLFCIFSRVFLVIESFISLRHVPLGIFAAIPWAQNIPHV